MDSGNKVWNPPSSHPPKRVVWKTVLSSLRNPQLLRPVWRLALPVILTNLLMALVNIADVFMVGRLGPIEIAAVGMSASVRLLVIIFALSVTAGAMALVAQAKGARDPSRLSFVVRQSISLTLVLALTLSLVGWVLAEPTLRFLNGDGDPLAVRLGTKYLQLLFAGTVFLAGNWLVSSLMQGAGDTVTPLFLSGAINVLNILFNYLLIFGPGPFPGLGVTGAALGTILARMLGVVAGLFLFYSGRNVVHILPGSYLPNWRMFRDILSIGIPSALQGMVRNTSQLLVIRIVTSTAAGSYGAAALAIGLQIESLAFMPGLAISIAATNLVGQSLGAWQVDDARRWGDAASLLGMIVMSIIGVLLVLFAPSLVRLFDPSAHPTVVAAGTSYIRIVSLSLPVLALSMVCNGALRGAGDTTPGLFGNLLGRWLIGVPTAYLLAVVLGMGPAGVWWGLVAGTAVAGIYVLIRWQGGRWADVALRKTDLYRRHLVNLPEETRERYLREIRTSLMARPGATEHIEEANVRYQLGQSGSVRIHFTAQDYQVAQDEGSEDRPIPGPNETPRT